jgi:carboxylesterase
MAFVARGLERAGYAVHCPVLAGHCDTEDALSETSWEDWYDSAEAGLRLLAERCGKVVVAGLSTGAVLALRLAVKNPQLVSGLALYSPTLWLNGRRVPWSAALFRLVRSRWLARLFRFPASAELGIKDQRLRAIISNAVASPGASAIKRATPGVAALERQRLVETVAPEIRHIIAPVLIMHPREDAYAGLSNATRLQEWLSGPVELVVLEDSYHLVTVDRQRGLVLERTLDFLARIGETRLAKRALH